MTGGRGEAAEYTPDIAFLQATPRAHWVCHTRGDQPKETVMTTPKLRLVSFGSAKALTQDGEIGPYFELLIVQSRTPA
jgi:hypothetical protein